MPHCQNVCLCHHSSHTFVHSWCPPPSSESEYRL